MEVGERGKCDKEIELFEHASHADGKLRDRPKQADRRRNV